VVRGTNDGIYHKSWTTSGGWSSWSRLPGTTVDKPETLVYTDVLCIAVRGSDNGIYYGRIGIGTGGWSGWERVCGGGATISRPTLYLYGSTINLFVRGTNGGIYYTDCLSSR